MFCIMACSRKQNHSNNYVKANYQWAHLDISVTCDVLNLETSNEVNFLQLLNIPIILVTREVLKLDTSNEVKELQ